MESGESHSAGYYCHKCNLTVQVPSTDLCPLCNDGFIEKLNPSSISSFADRNNEHREDIDSFPTVLRHVSDNFEVIVQGGDSSQGSLSDHRPSSSNRRDASSDAAQGNDRRRIRNQNYANSFEHVFSELLNTMTRPNAANLDGNAPLFLLSNPPGDYAWGREGLDTIVTQLLNQMDSSGPPPLSNDKIDAIPFAVVTDTQVSENTQCSVCWESFKLAENVRQLPCEHIYHDACILPWLQLHGTCPICRKLLCDDNDSRLGFSHTGNLEALFSNVNGFSMYPSVSRRQRRNNTGVRNPFIRCWSCSQFGHYARDCYRRNRNNRNNRTQQPQQAAPGSQPTPQNGAGDFAVDAFTPVFELTTIAPQSYVDIDDLDEDEDNDEDDDDDLYDGYSDYTDFNYESEYSDIDIDVLSFGGAGSGWTQQPLGSVTSSTVSGWPSLTTTTAASFGEAHPRRFRCFGCGAFGHKANECRVSRRNGLAAALRAQQPQSERCCHCGRRNHISDQCYYKPTCDSGVGGSSSTSASATVDLDGAGVATDSQSSQRQRYKSPPPPYPRRISGGLAKRASAGWSRPPGILKTRMSTPKTEPSQSRLRSPPPPRLVTPPPPLSTFSTLSLGRPMARAGGGGGTGSNSTGSSSTVGSSGRPTFGRTSTQSHQRREPICYRCHQPGHVFRDCVSENDMRECWTCGETGHLSRDCPITMI